MEGWKAKKMEVVKRDEERRVDDMKGEMKEMDKVGVVGERG